MSTGMLHTLAPFLSSSFVRVPWPAHGPLAFQEFWRVTYLGKSDLLQDIPANVRDCLKALDDVYGGHLAAELSHDVESQSMVCCHAVFQYTQFDVNVRVYRQGLVYQTPSGAIPKSR